MWWTAPRWRSSSPAAERSAEGRLQTPHVPVLVGPGPKRGVAVTMQDGAEQVGLVAAQLEQQGPSRTEEVGRLGDDPAQQREAIRAAVVMGDVLEREGVAGEEVELGGRHVG